MARNRPDHSLMSAALATPDKDVAPPPRVQPASAITQLAALKVGECFSRIEAIMPGMTVKDFAAERHEMKEALRNTVNSSLRHAKSKTGGEYTMEAADIVGASGGLYIGVIVRRVA